VKGQRGPMRRLVARALIGMATTVMAAALLAPTVSASPIGDAETAMMAAWEKAGGDTSPLGARKGDVYPVGDGFALDFDSGRMYYTTDTGAKFVFGPILDKYDSLGGPAGSDLGFPTINEVPGLAGPDSRVATFSASDKPVIFWTSEHGAYVVRGAMNDAWDKLGSSGGVLGAPTGDETYDGEVTSQKFSGGDISWNRQTNEFTTNPAVLADQLKGLQVVIDPTAAINMAWRAAGAATGPLGAKQGGTYPIGGDGIAQNFANGKVFFSPATGANALETDILAKYESLGGPAGSDLGFPTANESDGGITPPSRTAPFSASDKPVIFWTADHGAFVVRGAMKAAWDKLRGPAGKLGAPVGDQAVDGDVVSQQFTGGKISWNRAQNSFTTDPSNLAPLLSGLQVSGQSQPSTSAMPSHAKKLAWHWWWLLVAIPVLVLVVLAGLMGLGWYRRRSRAHTAAGETDHDDDGYGVVVDDHLGHDDADLATEHFERGDVHSDHESASDAGSAARASWSREAAADDTLPEDVVLARVYGEDVPSEFDERARREALLGVDNENPDAVDTDSFHAVSEDQLSEAGYPGDAEASAEDESAEGDHPDEHYAEVDHAEERYAEAAVPHTDSDAQVEDAVAADAAASDAEPRIGRHAAADAGAVSHLDGEAHVRPTMRLPLDDPYQVPDGYPIKANASFGLYYTPGSPLYHDTLAEFWFASEEVAQANGFVKAD
jgi:uncharacterized protein with LGFP repeats